MTWQGILELIQNVVVILMLLSQGRQNQRLEYLETELQKLRLRR